MFISSFKDLVHDVVPSVSKKLSLLRQLLTPKIRQALAHTLHNPSLYQQALQDLEKMFGHPQMVAQAHIQGLLDLPSVKMNEFAGLREFQLKLHGAVGTLKSCGYTAELRSASTLIQIVRKLPASLVRKWGRYEYRLRPSLATLSDLDAWLEDLVMGEMAQSPLAFIDSSHHSSPRSGDKQDYGSKQRGAGPKHKGKPMFQSVLATTSERVSKGPCHVCDKTNHPTSSCRKLIALQPTERANLIKEKKLCFRCFDPGHQSKFCSADVKCKAEGCKGKHHPLLHGALRVTTQEPQSTPVLTTSSEKTVVNAAHYDQPVRSVVLLSVVPIRVSHEDKSIVAYALLDPGSEVSLIRESVTRELGINGPKESIHLGTFHGSDPTLQTSRVRFGISSLDGTNSFVVPNGLTVPKLNIPTRKEFRSNSNSFAHLSDLDLPDIHHDQVSVLLGMDVAEAHVQHEIRRPPRGSRTPWAILTPFGWTLTGIVPSNRGSSSEALTCHVNFGPEDENLDVLLQQFWRTDSLGTKPHVTSPMSREDEVAFDTLSNTVRNIGNRYEAGLLWKTPDVRLPDNVEVARRRLFSTERRFQRDPDFANRYSQVVQEYIDTGHAKLVPPEEQRTHEDRTWYLPHHGVVHQAKPGKVRVVFDASAQFRGTSLNSNLIRGPDLLASLVGILIRFRQKCVAVSADIAKMFHQVRVIDKDQPALRFLWRTPGAKEPPKVYQMTVQIFGAVSSPAVCMYVLNKTADDNKDTFPEVSTKVKRNFYVDNYLDSYDDESEAAQSSRRLTNMLSKGGFHLTKWLSNSRHVLSDLPKVDLSCPDLDLDLDELPLERTLGLIWDAQQDVFRVQIHTTDSIATKRQALRTISSIYDPLGMLAPVVFTAKAILQELWRCNFGWDEELPVIWKERIQNWNDSLMSLSSLSIPRWFRKSSSPPAGIGLHIFADASEKGFGAVAYLRFKYADGSAEVSFVMAKTRIAPIAQLSIPRLELQGAIVALRMSKAITPEFDLNIDDTTYWTDSQTVLRWINSKNCRFHVFVGNRIGEILEMSQPKQWRFVPSADNPADDCSRGLAAGDLREPHRWYRGPDFLYGTEESWPSWEPITHFDSEDPEVRDCSGVFAIGAEEHNQVSELMTRCSTLTKLKRVIAWCLRFSTNTRLAKAGRFGGPLKVKELKTSLSRCLRVAQNESFPSEVSMLSRAAHISSSSSLLKMTPFLDKDGLLRVGGRLDRGGFPEDQKHPVILSKNHRLTQLIVMDTHVRLHHASTERILSELRQRFWVIRARQSIRSIISRCFECKRRSRKPQPPLMAPLPAHRLQPFLPAFTNIGIDYFGPLHVVIRRATVKRYGCIFTCLTTRAVHLEVSHSLDTDSFLMAFRRFCSRRGTPAVVYSDNGTNLTSGEKEIKEGICRWNQQKLSDWMSHREIQWHFSPPNAPHFGGVWERLIQSAKSALKFILRERAVTDEVLETVFAEVESLLNGRPLTHVSVNPQDPEALTPNHLLLGRANPNIPPDVLNDPSPPAKRRWEMSQTITNHFWRRWLREYVPNLIERRKWLQPRRNLQPGDVVLVVAPSSPRGHWPLGRIVKTHPGADGVVRTATVRTSHGEYIRPTTKLCLLEEDDSETTPIRDDR